MRKPIGRKAYGSIGHIKGSRTGPTDSTLPVSQSAIATTKARDGHDVVIVQEKLDGACAAIYHDHSGRMIALTRKGYLADESMYDNYVTFGEWVYANASRLRRVIHPGERLVGEWLAMVHGTIYKPSDIEWEPFRPFDIMHEASRMPFEVFIMRLARVEGLRPPQVISVGPPVPIKEAMDRLGRFNGTTEPIMGHTHEGVVYRVERNGEVDFLCKFVNPKKIDGAYLSSTTGLPPLFHYRPMGWTDVDTVEALLERPRCRDRPE